jgi:uncharacterized membrane protein
MNKFVLAAFLFFVFSLGFFSYETQALEISEYNITFSIAADASVKEDIAIRFAAPLIASELNYIVLGEISDLTISNGLQSIDYTLEKTGNEYNVKFSAPEGTEKLIISFIARDLVFAKDNVYSFFTDLKPPASKTVNIAAFLPKGFAIYRNVVYPEDYQLLSDGERIYLKWEFGNPEELMISFKFQNTHSDYSLLIMAIMGFALIVIVAYLVAHYRKKMKCEFERGFSEDERKVLFILSREKRTMQNKIEKELRFSRAKMTRLVKKLEAKGLVEKERVGRTNRLFYKK